MELYKFVSNSETDTMEFAKKLASKSKLGYIFILNGELGSGKTKFVEGFLSYFNLQNEISSPTFTIVNEYDAKDFKIYHFDVYRLNDIDEFFEIGGEEYFDNGISLIEWGEIIQDILPKKYIEINFEKDENNENKRILNLIFHDIKKEELI